MTPVENLESRFGKEKGKAWVYSMHAVPVEQLYRLPRTYEKRTLASLLHELRPRIQLLREGENTTFLLDCSLHTKRFDSSIWTYYCIGHHFPYS